MSDNEYTVLLPDPEAPEPLALPAETSASRWARWRRRTQHYLESKQKHYLILGLVALDVLAILTEIMLSLITCDAGAKYSWVPTAQSAIKVCSLIFSCLFMAELTTTVWAFGWGFFSNWFHCFDAFVIIVSFVVDVLAHGIVEEIASLVIVLRLWRMVKMVQELSVGASEQMEELEAKIEKLEQEKEELLIRLHALEQGN